MVQSFGPEKNEAQNIRNGITNYQEDESLNLITEDTLTINALNDELESVALDWKSARGVKECVCSATLDFPSPKVNSLYYGLYIASSSSSTSYYKL